MPGYIDIMGSDALIVEQKNINHYIPFQFFADEQRHEFIVAGDVCIGMELRCCVFGDEERHVAFSLFGFFGFF